jgi:hypothetical protein
VGSADSLGALARAAIDCDDTSKIDKSVHNQEANDIGVSSARVISPALALDCRFCSIDRVLEWRWF